MKIEKKIRKIKIDNSFVTLNPHNKKCSDLRLSRSQTKKKRFRKIVVNMCFILFCIINIFMRFPLDNQHVQLLILLQVVVDVIMLEKDFSSKEEVCLFLKIANYDDIDKFIR